MKNVAIILGAGNSTRMKSDKSKMLLELDGKTVIERSVNAFSNINDVDEIIVVGRETDIDIFKNLINNNKVKFVVGGNTRQESVQNAVSTIDDCDLIIIHDGARPLVTEDTIVATINMAKSTKGAATGVFVKDTIKVIDENKTIVSTPNRSNLVAIQTPQIFDFKLYKMALKTANDNSLDFTDDCQLVENIGSKVSVVIGEYSNIKITTKDDIPMAESLLQKRGE